MGGATNPVKRPRSSGGALSTVTASNTNLPSQQSTVSNKKEQDGKKSMSKEASAMKRWSHRRSGGSSSSAFSSTQIGYDLTNGQGALITLPPPLRAVLEVIDNGILEGHALLSEALRVSWSGSPESSLSRLLRVFKLEQVFRSSWPLARLFAI